MICNSSTYSREKKIECVKYENLVFFHFSKKRWRGCSHLRLWLGFEIPCFELWGHSKSMWLKARRPLAQDGPGRWYIRKWEYKLAWAPQVSGEERPMWAS